MAIFTSKISAPTARHDSPQAAGTVSLPLERDTCALAHEFIAADFQAYIVCLDPRVLDTSFAGRPYDEQLLADLPASVDPCGENGEFHTFVHAGPIFTEPIVCEAGEVIERDGFVFCDLMPA